MSAVCTPAGIEVAEPVSFACEGHRLFGMLHRPDGPVRLGVILLNQGPVDKAGSHRTYVRLATELAALGCAVLRFDARGVGESEGLWEGEEEAVSILDMYGDIQRGVWVPDARAAIQFMREQVGVSRVVLGGLCGGANTALLTAAGDDHVVAAFAIGTPVTFSSVTRNIGDLPDAIIARDAAGYVRKIFRREAWARFLSFQTDYRTLLRVFAVQVQRRFAKRPAAAGAPPADDKINVPMFEAIHKLARAKKPLLLVYGETDYLWQEFQEQMPRLQGRNGALPFELVTIPEANHTLTEEPWQDALLGATRSWLQPLADAALRRSA